MPQKRNDYVTMFPDPEAQLRTMRHEAPQFMRCPNGHTLPHRTTWGRCSPVDCCDYGQANTRSYSKDNAEKERWAMANTVPYKDEMDLLPMGMEGEAAEKTMSMAESAQTQQHAAEAIELMKARGAAAAREAAHTAPPIPKPLPMDGKTPQEYVKERLDQISPWLLEQRILDARYAKSDKARTEAVQELLDRAGHGRKPDVNHVVNAPVIFVQGFQSPYEKQKTLAAKEKTVEHRELAERSADDAARAVLSAERGAAILAEYGFTPGSSPASDSPGSDGEGAEAAAGGDSPAPDAVDAGEPAEGAGGAGGGD